MRLANNQGATKGKCRDEEESPPDKKQMFVPETRERVSVRATKSLARVLVSLSFSLSLSPPPSLFLSLSLSFITRVAPHCVNTLMILHAAHITLTHVVSAD